LIDFQKQIRALSLLPLVAALTACGGGSSPSDAGSNASGSSSSGSTGSSSTVVLSGPTLITVAPATDYTAGTMEDTAVAALNAARLASGSGALSHSTALDVATTAHANYDTAIYAHGETSQVPGYPHNEVSTVEPNLYYGDTPLGRIDKALGTSVSFADEVVGGAHLFNGSGQMVADGTSCANGFLGTVYHADIVLSQATVMAVAQWQDSIGEQGCIIDLATTTSYGQVPASSSAVVNPAPNTTVSGAFDIDGEQPRPAGGLIPTGTTAGTPVLVNVRNVDWVNAQANGKLAPVVNPFTLATSGGTQVPAVILTASGFTGSGVTSDAQLLEGSMVLIPKATLAAGTYSVHVDVTLTSGVKVVKDWNFTAQ